LDQFFVSLFVSYLLNIQPHSKLPERVLLLRIFSNLQCGRGVYGSVFGHAVDYVIKGRKSRSDKDGDARSSRFLFGVKSLFSSAKAPTND
jgi:hypothetical protein